MREKTTQTRQTQASIAGRIALSRLLRLRSPLRALCAIRFPALSALIPAGGWR